MTKTLNELSNAFEGKEEVKKKLVDQKKKLDRIKTAQSNHLRNVNDSEMAANLIKGEYLMISTT